MKVALVIEYSQKNVFFAIEANPSKSEKVVETGQVKLKELPLFLLGLKGRKDIKVALIAEKIISRKFFMPPAKEKLIRELLRRQLVQMLKTEVIFRYREIDSTTVEGLKKKVVQAVGAEYSLVSELYALFEKNRARPSIITTYPAAVAELLRSKYGDNKVIAFVEMNDSFYITVIKGPEIRIFRHLGRKSLEGNMEPQMSPELLAKALLQTLFYHKQEFRGENIDLLVLSGKDAENYRDFLKKELQIEILVFENHEKFPLKGLLGLLSMDRKSCFYNLLPPEAIEKEKTRKIFLAGTTVLLLLISLIAFRHARLTAQYQNLNYFKKELEKSVTKKQMNLRELSKEFIAFQVEKAQPPWPDLLFELSALIPGRIILTSLSIEREGDSYKGEAEGKIICESEIEGIQQVEEMKRRFKLSPFFENVTFEEDVNEEGMNFKMSFSVPIRGKLVYGY